MSVIHISQSQTTTYEISEDDDIYVLDPDTWIYPVSEPAIHIGVGATGNRLVIRGTVGISNNEAAINVEGEDTRILVDKTGNVTATTGIGLNDVSADIVNRGYIGGGFNGLLLTNVTGRVVNHGYISADNNGTAISQTVSNGAFRVENHGVLTGYTALFVTAPELTVEFGKTSKIFSSVGVTTATSQLGDTTNVVNNGLMSCALGYAFGGGAAEDTFTNRGTIYGDVFFGEGDDRFIDNGKFVGVITGGGGDDTFVLKRQADIVEAGGGGTDTVKTAASFILSDEVERLIASGRKNIELGGGESANTIRGNAGNNRIEGGEGGDTLTGGGGRDLFVYALSDGADTITDFRQGQDRIRIEGFTTYDNFADLDFVKSGKDVRISFADENGADYILVENQKIGDFDKGDFIFG
jgi:Ca2+-binding RTX toxin-like protein